MAKRPILNRKAFRKSMRRHAVMSLAALMVTQNAMVSFASVSPTNTQIEESTKKETEEESKEVIEEETEAETEETTEEETEAETEETTEGETEAETEETIEGETEAETEGTIEGETEAETEETTEEETEAETEETTESGKDEEILDEEILEDDKLLEEEIPVGTPSNATPVDIFENMPEIGTSDFTEWFFDNVKSEDLWNWVLELMESTDEEDETVESFMKWYAENENRVNKAYHEFSGMATLESSTGDLWTGWTGNTQWNGDGTEAAPYEISELSDLMGLSEMVAAGNDFAGKYFVLTQDIDIGNLKQSWNPIGWYQNKADLGKAVTNKFRGNFDGAGNTISGLKVVNVAHTLNNIGLFGAVEGGSITNLTVDADGGVKGGDNVGILAGSVEGDTIIYNVTVTGSISSTGDAGGIAGQVTGDRNAKAGTVTIENCIADGITIQATDDGSYVGGIAGNAQNTNIIDVSVRTYDDGSNRIQGQGYVGGIVGRQNRASLYNTMVEGTIGGSGSRAIGGIVGKYESGNTILARFDGTVANSNNGGASREGTFFGTRDGANNFSYGTGKSDNFAYLFTTDASMAKKPFGSNIDKDNSFTTDAHIGYWTNDGRNFHLVAGTLDKEQKDVYFYEELEAAVKHIVINKLGNTFSTEEYWDGCDFKIDHFAPNSFGAPIRGYLVSIPRIDAATATGYDTDVATLTAIGKTTNSYYKQIDMDNPSAVAYGDVIEVATAAKNRNGNRYQMVYDENEPGKVKPPTYTDENGDVIDMTYQYGGHYTFTMPEADTELNVEYIKVTTGLTMTPPETTIKVVQTREGDRKNPQITTAVYNQEGKLIAKYIGDTVDQSVTPDPVSIHAEHNGEGSAHDKTVKWSIDNENLLVLSNVDTTNWTEKDARVMPNMKSNFITTTLNKKVQEQIDSGYANAIDNTVYSDVAIVTASTNPDTSVDNQAVTANTRVNVTFQIIDNTTRRVEGLVLSESDIVITITRKLTGDRTKPVETIFCDEPSVLGATLNPSRPFNKNVTWRDENSGSIIVLEPYGDHSENCRVTARYNADGVSNPQWIQSVIQADNQKRAKDKYVKLDGSATKTEVITSVADDQTHGEVSAKCNVTLNFVTVDETVIHPESVSMSQNMVNYDLAITKAGDINSEIKGYDGFETIDLDCTVNPDCPVDDAHEPYDRSVTWSVSDPDVLSIDQDGNITPNKDAQWIKDAMVKAPYKATKTVEVYATANDNGVKGTTTVTLNYVTNCVELDKETMDYNLSFTKAGDIKSATTKTNGFDARNLVASVYPEQKDVVWASSDADAVTVVDGKITVNENAQWIKDAMAKAPYTATKTVNVTATYNGIVDTCVLTLNFKTNCVELPSDTLTYNMELIKSGRRSSPTYTWKGADAKKFVATPYPDTKAAVTYGTSNAAALTVAKDGTIAPVLNVDAEWMKPAMSYPYTATTKVNISGASGESTDVCVVTLNIKVTDNTYSGGSSSGGGGGGGGSSSGGGGGSHVIGGSTTGGPGATGPGASVPDYVIKDGKWVFNENNSGKWNYKVGNINTANKWAAIFNPYADTSKGQEAFSWFRFDANGFMVTGWFTDTDGNVYFLHNVSDNTLGRMYTGWNWITGADGKQRCYYFNPVSDGFRGKLMKNTTIKDSTGTWTVNQNGEWTVNGVVQVR